METSVQFIVLITNFSSDIMMKALLLLVSLLLAFCFCKLLNWLKNCIFHKGNHHTITMLLSERKSKLNMA